MKMLASDYAPTTTELQEKIDQLEEKNKKLREDQEVYIKILDAYDKNCGRKVKVNEALIEIRVMLSKS